MPLAPDYDVPPEVSPFTQLPLLSLCTRCKGPIEPWREMAVARHGHYMTGLCAECAAYLDKAWLVDAGH